MEAADQSAVVVAATPVESDTSDDDSDSSSSSDTDSDNSQNATDGTQQSSVAMQPDAGSSNPSPDVASDEGGNDVTAAISQGNQGDDLRIDLSECGPEQNAETSVAGSSPLPVASPEPHRLAVELPARCPSPGTLKSGNKVSPHSPGATPLGTLGWRPIMPGYLPVRREGGDPGGRSLFIRTTVQVEGNVSGTEASLKESIPVMRRPLAVICCLLNVVCPGFGTFMAGLSVLCCSAPRPLTATRLGCLWVNSCVALLQLITTIVLLLGWVWSIAWGLAFLARAGRIDDCPAEEGPEDGISRRARSQHSEQTLTTTRVTTTTVAVPSSVRSYPDPPGYVGDPGSQAIIGLHEAPIITDDGAAIDEQIAQLRVATRGLNPFNPRHQRRLRTAEERLLPAYLLNSQALESIVINNAPVPDQLVFGHGDQGASSSGAGRGGYSGPPPKAGPSRRTVRPQAWPPNPTRGGARQRPARPTDPTTPSQR